MTAKGRDSEIHAAAKNLSMDAIALARGLFRLGVPSSLTFARPHIIHERTLAALAELERAGMVSKIDADALPRGGAGWKATKKIGRPSRDFPASKASWPIVTE